jgi:hypothetical protein
METQNKTSAKDFFINLGAIVALYTTVVSLVNLLFSVINSAYPQITNGYNYSGSESISWPVSAIIIFFPIFLILMWLLAKDYKVNPEKQSSGIHKWLTYITLFIAGLTIAGDLITVLYYFLDGQELTTGFLLKILALLIIVSGIFSYYLHDVMGKLTSGKRNFYRVLASVIILGSIVWGFSVLGSPRTQQLLKYDQQKISDLQNIQNSVESFYSTKGTLPKDLAELSTQNYYFSTADSQTKKPHEYKKTGDKAYQICAVFNKEVKKQETTTSPYNYAYPSPYDAVWTHPAGAYCFDKSINPNLYAKPVPAPMY